jgi:hypothetical protein
MAWRTSLLLLGTKPKEEEEEEEEGHVLKRQRPDPFLFVTQNTKEKFCLTNV